VGPDCPLVFSVGRQVPASTRRRPTPWFGSHRTTRPRRKGSCRSLTRCEVIVNLAVSELSRKGRTGLRPGFCIDTGAPASVIGLKEVRRIANNAGKREKLRPSNKRFRFADATFDSLGKIFLPLATPNGSMPIYVEMDVVAAFYKTTSMAING